MEQEYMMLREEIENLYQKRDEYTRFAYTAIAAIWTIALTINNAWMLLLGMILLLPLTLRVTGCLNSIYYIAAYMAVVLEPHLDIKWETMNYKFRKEDKRRDKNFFNFFHYMFGRADFVLLQCVNVVLFWMMWFGNDDTAFKNVTVACLVAGVQLIILIVGMQQCYKESQGERDKERSIAFWKEIVKQEKSQIG